MRKRPGLAPAAAAARVPHAALLLPAVLLLHATLLLPAEGLGVTLPDGLWWQEAYGEAVVLSADAYRHFELTRSTCVERPARPRREAEDAIGSLDEAEAPGLEDEATRTVRRGISRYAWRRLARLPEPCARGVSNDPAGNLETLLRTFEERYAFFGLRGVDWTAVSAQARARLASLRTDEDLFALMSDALAPLGDRHVRLTAGERRFVSGGIPPAVADPDGVMPRYASLQPALKRYMATVVEGGLETMANDQVWWGWLVGGVAYVALPSLWDFSGRQETTQAIERRAADEAMDAIMEQVRPASGLILDLRANNGGSDGVGLAIVERLVRRPAVAFTKQAWLEGREVGPYEVRVAPAARPSFAGPVAVLIGPYTASAAEVMVLGLRTQDHVALFGQPTMGVFSDTLYRRLPNGWAFTLSNEIYRTSRGEVFEGRGIPPQVAVPPRRAPSSLDQRFGPEIRAALAWLRERGRQEHRQREPYSARRERCRSDLRAGDEAQPPRHSPDHPLHEQTWTRVDHEERCRDTEVGPFAERPR